jgi:primosomal protein N'
MAKREDPTAMVVGAGVGGLAVAIRLAAAHDYESFAREELAMRARFGLPPSTRMARVVVRDPHRACASAQAARSTEATAS